MNLGMDVRIDTRQAERKLKAIGRRFEPNVVLKFVGQNMLFWVNQNFRTGGSIFQARGWRRLSPNTLANPRRGGFGAQPLRNTGRLAQSFTAYGVRLIGRDAVRVGTEMKYASYHQFGTAPYTIRPVRARVLAFWTVSGLTFRKVVRHPGLPPRMMLPSLDKAREIVTDSVKAYVDRAIALAKAGV